MTSKLGYRPDIDGLRGVAVLLVMIYHAGIALPGGFVGVDVFFVISGFVITKLINREYDEQTFTMSNFWIRRIRRILPASLAMTVTTLFLGAFILFPKDYETTAITAFFQQAMAANFFLWKTTGYFNQSAELNPLLHTWSLAVEEQFYLIYPAIFIFLKTRFSKALPTLITIAAITSIGISEWSTHNHNAASFYLLPSRAWELLLGCLICFAPRSTFLRRVFYEGISILGISMILYASLYFDTETQFPGFSALVPCVGTALIIYANRDASTVTGKLLSLKPLVSIGLLSYSLYLWHWPIIVIAKHWFVDDLSLVSRLFLLLVTFPIAYGSWALIENPVRKQTLFRENRTLLTGLIITTITVFSISYAIGKNDGFPNRIAADVAEMRAASKNGYQTYPQTKSDIEQSRLPQFGSTNGKLKALIWGDSHAMMLIPCLNEVFKRLDVQGYQATYNSTPPLIDFTYSPTKFGLDEEAPRWNASVLKWARKNRIDFIVIAGVWHNYAKSANFKSAFTQTINQITNAGIRVLIVKDVPWQEQDVPLMLAKAKRRGVDLQTVGISLSAHHQQSMAANRIIDSASTATMTCSIDPLTILCRDEKRCQCFINDVVIYSDAHHLTIEGAKLLEDLYEEKIQNLILADKPLKSKPSGIPKGE